MLTLNFLPSVVGIDEKISFITGYVMTAKNIFKMCFKIGDFKTNYSGVPFLGLR
jgi:hypothetical protein